MTRLLVASNPDGGGGGVVLADPGTRESRMLARADGLDCLVRHPGLPVLYGLAIGVPDTVHVWRVRDDRLDPLTTLALPGTGVCAAAVVGGHLVLAHYSCAAITSLPLDDDGIPRPGTTVALHGDGPDTSRQERAHPHHVLDHDGLALVTDLGSDRLWWLRPADLAVVGERALPAGCGPRHTVALPGGCLAVAGELDATLVVVPGSGEPVPVPASARPGEDRTYPSDLLAHPAGLVVLANRNAGTLALFDVTGTRPRLVDETDCAGSWPLNLALAGDTVAVAQRDDDTVVLLDIDPGSRSWGPPRGVPGTPVPRPTWVLVT